MNYVLSLSKQACVNAILRVVDKAPPQPTVTIGYVVGPRNNPINSPEW